MLRQRRSASPPVAYAATGSEEELRLPRAPGVFRRFWTRHPLLTDILLATLCLVLSVGPVRTVGSGAGGTAVEPWAAAFVSWLVVASCILLVWRRRLPLVSFTASMIVAATYLALPLSFGGPLVMFTTYTVAVYRSARACWIAVAVGLGALTCLASGLASIGTIGWSVALNAIVGELVLALLGALVGVNVGNRKRYLAAVIDRSRQLLVERDQQAQLAAAGERSRIAREMHDVVSHSLTVIVALTEGASATADADRAREATDAAADVARGALAEMRAMLGVLREGDPDAPLSPAVPVRPADTVAAAQRAGFPATFEARGGAIPDGPVGFAVGRIVQEGMTNAMRHAPAATRIAVRMMREAEDVVIDITNDGVPSGRAVASGGFGLRGLSERAASVGGSIRSERSGADGWVLRARLPLDGDAGGSG